MSAKNTRYTPEETADRGDEIYERIVRAHVEAANHGKVVAIDVETESFEIGDDAIEASDKLLARVSDAEIWFVRVGHQTLHRIGAQSATRLQ